MINRLKVLPTWQKVIGAVIIILVLLVVRVILKGIFTTNDLPASVTTSTTNQDYFSYHGPKLIQLDKDMQLMVNDILKISRGDQSPSTITDLTIQSGGVDKDIIDLQAYNGTIPTEYAQADQLLSDSLSDLQSANSDITTAVQNDDATSFQNDVAKIIEGRNLYKQAADDMISAHNKQ